MFACAVVFLNVSVSPRMFAEQNSLSGGIAVHATKIYSIKKVQIIDDIVRFFIERHVQPFPLPMS